MQIILKQIANLIQNKIKNNKAFAFRRRKMDF